MTDRDRPTPPDPHRPAKPPRPAQAPRSEPIDTLDEQRRVDHAKATLRRVGADRAKLEQRRETPRGLPVPSRPTWHDGAPPPASMGTPASFPPPIAKPTPPSGTAAQGDRRAPIPVVVEDTTPSSRAPTKGDWAKLRYRLAAAAVAALVLVIAALGYYAVTLINSRTEALKAAQEAKKKADDRDGEWRSWASVAIWIVDCRNDQQGRVNEQLLPSAEKMGSARKLEPWKDACPTKLPPPP